MKVIKPFRLSVVTRSYEVQRKCYLGVSTLLFFDLRTSELLPEVALWQFAAEELGTDAAIDAGVPKRNAEYLVSGSVFAPGGEPTDNCPASVKIGDLEKTVYAIGDRFWRTENEWSDPEPFTAMPISWELAYGGEGHAPNTYGKGHAPVETEHGPVQFLPNLENPGELVRHPSDVRDPACFGVLDLTRPQRLAKAGTYDQQWLKELFPGVAADMDWTFWNIASEDQQRANAWRGDEAYELKNLHPTQPSIRGVLPGLRARTFLKKRDAEGSEALHELENRLTTVWFFPHAEKGILISQGAIETLEDDATDVTLLMLAAERVTEPRDRAHYDTVLAARLDKDTGVFHALKDEELLPPDLVASFETKDEIEKMKDIVLREPVLQERLQARMRRNIEEARELIRSHGLEPDDHGPSQPEPFEVPPMEDIPALMEQLEVQMKEKVAENERELEASLVRDEALMKSHGIDPAFLREELDSPHVGPPAFSAEGELERIRGLDAMSRSHGVVLDELTEWIGDVELHARWKQAEDASRDAYVLSAHVQREAPRMDPEMAAGARSALLAALQRGEPMAYRDLTGADLSGLDLRGADFRRGWLESVDLSGSNLDGADLTECVLARADLSGCSLAGTKLHGANLGSARLVDVRGGPGLDLSEAILTKADLSRADLGGATLDRTNLTEAVFEETSFRGSTATGFFFYQTDLRGASFAGATIAQSTFIECVIAGVDFGDSHLDRVVFMGCEGSRVRFAGAHTSKLVVCMSKPFDRADFKGAHLANANLRGVSLAGADFSEAVLDSADLCEADLSGAKLYRIVARGARFSKASLEGADLTAANLMGADLSKADLSGAVLLGSNLYGANFAKVRTRVEADLREANQKKVTIYPLWRPS